SQRQRRRHAGACAATATSSWYPGATGASWRSSSKGMWQRMVWPGAASTIGGAVVSQVLPILRGQRAANGQPGNETSKAGVPSRRIVGGAADGSGMGIAESSASVYGWYGGAKTCSTVPCSTIRPAYMT